MIDLIEFLFRCMRDGHELRELRLGGDYSPVKLATSDSGDFVFVIAADCKAWDQVSQIVEHLLGSAAKPRDVAYAFEAALAATLDPDPQGRPYGFGRKPLCPICGERMDTIDVASPLVVAAVRAQCATHLAWHHLEPEGRVRIVAEAVRPWVSRP